MRKGRNHPRRSYEESAQVMTASSYRSTRFLAGWETLYTAPMSKGNSIFARTWSNHVDKAFDDEFVDVPQGIDCTIALRSILTTTGQVVIPFSTKRWLSLDTRWPAVDQNLQSVKPFGLAVSGIRTSVTTEPVASSPTTRQKRSFVVRSLDQTWNNGHEEPRTKHVLYQDCRTTTQR